MIEFLYRHYWTVQILAIVAAITIFGSLFFI